MGADKKKPKAKAKSSAKAEPVVSAEEQKEAEAKAEARRIWTARKEGQKWATKKVEELQAQREAAKKDSQAWLEEHHKWHEAKLQLLAKSLEDKLLDGIPDEVKTGFDAYLAQCAEGAAGKEDNFKDHRDLYKDLSMADEPAENYVRDAASPEAASAADTISAWTDTTPDGMSKFVEILTAHANSAHVQDAGLCRIGWLFQEHKDKPPAAEIGGLTAEVLYAPLKATMITFKNDKDLQKAGCAALRGLAMTDGQLQYVCENGAADLLTTAIKVHLKVADVVQAANAAFWAMSQKAGKNSPELAFMKQAGATEALQKAMAHHAWDQTLVGRIRVTLPFLQED
eukprot:TRINITY_DN5774_c0_g1_i6.p1 TRINITY_DN5774_c0_g1~~TRINITY_DN5774_c0_g1_i6.p1  ORF type:complete len:341 (+),score=114.28 TRINITY_DN5774_c0_g1_i6:73-1095(+)